MLIPQSDFNFIGKFENFENDFIQILKLINSSLNHSDIITHTPHLTNAGNKLDQYFDYRTIDIISRIYEEDFAAFGYKK
jgi:hypothetical protein